MRVALLGGRGFFGSAVASVLRADGYDVVTVDRRSGGAGHVVADLLDTARLVEVFAGVDAVVNFVGLTPARKPKKGMYERVHVDGAASAALACEQTGVDYLVHVSALGVASDAPTQFLRTKFAGEEAVEAFTGKQLILRPSVLLAEDNELVRALDSLSVTRVFVRTTGMLQPVYLQDAASYVSSAISARLTGVAEIAGPDLLTLSDLAEFIYARKDRSCVLLPLWLARLGATTLALLPRTRIGFDQVRSLSLHNTIVPESTTRQDILDTSLKEYL